MLFGHENNIDMILKVITQWKVREKSAKTQIFAILRGKNQTKSN